MALEKSLWKRVKNAGVILVEAGHRLHMCRVENEVGAGMPDVEGCLDGRQFFLELKSNKRPARATTPIHPRTRDAQRDWHAARAKAGSRSHYVLMQVGEASTAKLYLIPGTWYDLIHTTESELEDMSLITPRSPMSEILLQASRGW